jgi:hypothetical protein
MTSKKTKPKAEKLKISSRFKKFEQDLREIFAGKIAADETKQKLARQSQADEARYGA